MSDFLNSLTPAQRRIHEALCDSSFLSGLNIGWNCGVDENADQFDKVKRSRQGHLAGVKKAREEIARVSS